MYAPTPATPVVVAPNVTHDFLNMNPPHFHLLVLPLALLSPTQALLIWTLASLLSLGGCLYLIVRELAVKLSAARVLWALLAILTFAATGTVIATGQLSLLLLMPVTLAWLAARRGGWTRAGAWLGLAMSVKPFLFIFVPYFLLRRRPRAAVTALLVVAGAFLTGLAVFGVPSHLAWLSALDATDWSWAAMNGSILGALSRMLSESPYFTPFVSAPGLVRPLWLCGAAIAGVATLAAAWRDDSPEAVDRGFVLVLVGAQLVSPLGWIYYFWLPVGPAAALVVNWLRERRERTALRGEQPAVRWRNVLLWTSLPCLMWPLGLVTAQQPSALATATLGSVYFWGTVLLWAGVLVDELRASANRRWLSSDGQ
jgi:glycosyl transferase family 87